MQLYKQSKREWEQFLTAIQPEFELIAPVQKDLVRFEAVKDPKTIHFTHNAYFPLKGYFFKKKEPVLLWVGKAVETPKLEAPKRIFFGVRKCDLNAIHKQDRVYLEDVHDPFYASARKNSVLIGYHCETPPSEMCFCGSMNLKDYFDLQYYDRNDHFLIEAGTEKGEMLIKTFSKFFTKQNQSLTQDERTIHYSDRLKKKDIKSLYGSKEWEKGVGLCLSCGACTTLCPTCYCFELHDEVHIDNPEAGERVRSWSSCMLPEFTRVAGDHVFRKEREQRFKHRIYHQLDYFKEKHGEPLCVGCGRCIDGCPTRIDFVKIINEMP